MKLKAFKGMDKNELSMIEVAHEILSEKGDVMYFSDMVNEIQKYLEKSDAAIRENLPQFYTDLNIDGSFISLGDNKWGLRSWYPIDSIDEEVSHGDDDDEDAPRRKKRNKKVNAFIGVADEDAIDYNDDDPEDEDLNNTTEEDFTDVDEDDDDDEELVAYDSELSEIGADEDPEDELPDGAEGDLNIVDEDYDDDDDEDYGDEEEQEV